MSLAAKLKEEEERRDRKAGKGGKGNKQKLPEPKAAAYLDPHSAEAREAAAAEAQKWAERKEQSEEVCCWEADD